MGIKNASSIRIKPRIADVVNGMAPGDEVFFRAEEFGEVNTARGAVCRANARVGRKEFECVTTDRGVTYTVRRKVMTAEAGKEAENGVG